MSILSGFLLALFVIVAILMILLVLAQNEDGDTMGGVFGGGSNTAFGSRSGNILTKTSSVLGLLFFALAFSLALINRTPDDGGVEAAARQDGAEAQGGWYLENEDAGGKTSLEPGADGANAAE